MTTVALRLPDDVIEALDALVGQGHYATRTAVIRTAVDALLAAHERLEIDRAIVAGYTRIPDTDEEIAMAEAALRAVIEEEPW